MKKKIMKMWKKQLLTIELNIINIPNLNIQGKKRKNSPTYVGVTILELNKLHMYDVFSNIEKPSLRDLQLQFMNTDSFVQCHMGVDDTHMALSNLGRPTKTNNKKPGKFKHEYGSNTIEDFITLSPQTLVLNIIMLMGRNKELQQR